MLLLHCTLKDKQVILLHAAFASANFANHESISDFLNLDSGFYFEINRR
jgi:hypothetical protein